ncbi:MAG: phosphatase PAP2 family protein, partial [Mediterranea sp.]|nr:phosphatase PAP2 family protein [Mediterranea sp.]
MIYPASAIVVGSVASGSGFGKKINRRVRRAIEHKKRPIRADDYLQYLPTVSVFGLSLTGARAKHDYLDRAVITTTSYLMMGIMVNTVKYTTRVQRPGRGSRNSFPSGHTATAFMGAELLRLEYGTWAGVAGYSLASAIGVARIYNGRHWVSDVLVGSGVGILSAHAGYYLHPLIRPLYRKDKRGM